MTRNSISLLSIVCFFVILYSCSASKTTASATTSKYSYSKDVRAIINENCANTCHNADRPAAGIDLTTYAKVKDQCVNGKLIPAIQHAEGVDPMPKKAPKLDDATIAIIVQWTAEGTVE